MTRRAVVFGVLLALPVCFWNSWQPTGTIYSLLFSTMAALIVLVMINKALLRWAPALAFETRELVVIYAFVSVASAVSGEWTFLNMQYVHVFAGFPNLDPRHESVFLKHLPEIFYFHDTEAVRDYVSGGRGYLYFLSRMDLWLPKLLAWTALYTLITVSLLCINSLMRDAWLRRERLSFPLIQFPVAMMEERGNGPMWRNRLMLVSFLVMFSIDILNGLHYLYPNLPHIPLKDYVDLRYALPERPFLAMGFTPISVYPFLIALALLVPADLLFSVVFFFLVRKLILIGMSFYGYQGGSFAGGFLTPEAPYFTEQTWGALLGLFVSTLWFARNHLKSVARAIWSGEDSDDGGIRHRTAVILLFLCVSGVVAVLVYAGLHPLLAIPYFLAFLAFSFVLTRIRAQLGPPTHEFAFLGPNQLLFNFYGTKTLSERTAAFLGTVFLGINRLSRSHPMPVQLEAMKMAEDQRVRQGPLFWLMAFALVFGLFVGAMWTVQRGYVRGAEPGWADPSAVVTAVVDQRHGPSVKGILAVAAGALLVAALDFIRFRVPGFWLHPVGYALSMNFGVDYYWFCLILALLLKVGVQRYFGLKGFRQLRFAAFGVLLGEFAAEAIWATIAMATRQSTYTIGFNERGLGLQ
ncbi:MAG: hypothetical protein KatS3mg015_0419 [Fimbriimonadales bacterium]|nr:MAG: hypothetical protein KatS3mg015_0419 [Fimbriimonadales bacterium]